MELARREDADEIGGSEPRLSSMVALSAVLHLALVAGGLVFSDLMGERRAGPVAYTVELVSARELGGRTSAQPRARVVKPPHPATPKAKTDERSAEKKPLPAPPPPKKRVVPDKPAAKPVLRNPPAARRHAAEKPRSHAAKRTTPPPSRAAGISPAEREKKIAAAIARVRRKVGGTGAVTGSVEGSGGGGIVKGVEFLIYYNRMLAKIKESWAWVGSRSDLEATVRFSVLETGSIASLRIVRSSGDPSYDASVLRAMKAADPLPPPPPRYRDEFRDVELTFRPREPASAG